MASLPTDPSSKREFYVRDGRRQVTFSCRCEPAAPSSDFLASLRASGLVKRLFGVAACQRPRQATFWRRCEPAASSSDFFVSL